MWWFRLCATLALIPSYKMHHLSLKCVQFCVCFGFQKTTLWKNEGPQKQQTAEEKKTSNPTKQFRNSQPLE